MLLVKVEDIDRCLYDHLDDANMVAARNAIDDMPKINLDLSREGQQLLNCATSLIQTANAIMHYMGVQNE